MWRIPIELHRRCPALPLYCDPSHIAGRSSLVGPLAQTAMDMEFDGLIIECHCNPGLALSDSAQQITPAALAGLINTLRANRRANTGDIVLEECRRAIDSIDDELMELLARRMQVAREIGRIKTENAMPVVQPQRYRQLIEKRLAEADRLRLDPAFVRQFLAVLHEESVRQQIERDSSHTDNF